MGFPWSDDLIGAYLRRLRALTPEQREQRRQQAAQRRAAAEAARQPAAPAKAAASSGAPSRSQQGELPAPQREAKRQATTASSGAAKPSPQPSAVQVRWRRQAPPCLGSRLIAVVCVQHPSEAARLSPRAPGEPFPCPPPPPQADVEARRGSSS